MPLACRGAFVPLRYILHFATFHEQLQFDLCRQMFDCSVESTNDVIVKIDQNEGLPGTQSLIEDNI